MTPTYKELLKGATTWRLKHMDVDIILSHHGYRDGSEYEGAEPHPGTWCFYLIIPEEMYPHRWPDFACVRKGSGFETHGPAWDDDWFYSGITWSSSEPYWSRKENRLFDAAKVGCDYSHLWDMEQGYPQTFEWVKQDAERAVEQFLEAHPDRRLRSSWSHKWGAPDEFYRARNGGLVHKEDELPENYDSWLPAEESGND